MTYGWPLCALTMCVLLGCTSVDDRLGMQQNASVISLWEIYGHCRASHDLDTMWTDSHQLRQAARSLKSQQPLQILPEAMERLLWRLPSRWSVDPDALAADCSLRAGLMAQEKGRPRLAEALFRLVAMTYPVDQYAYYIEQASQHLQARERITALFEKSRVPLGIVNDTAGGHERSATPSSYSPTYRHVVITPRPLPGR